MLERVPLALVVDDERKVRDLVRQALERQGWDVQEAADCDHGLLEAATRSPELVMLDLGLPDHDGIHFIGELRKWSSLPVLVYSGLTREADKIAALDAGADDFVSKPAPMGELMARVRALRRRQRLAGSTISPVLQFGDVRVDLQTRLVTRGGVPVRLSPTEYHLLAILARNAGRVVTTGQLFREAWGDEHVKHVHYLRIYMGHLRHKLEAGPAHPRFLLTETGVGYRLHQPN